MAVTNNIREIREQRGIYQDDLAAAIGYSDSCYPVPCISGCYSQPDPWSGIRCCDTARME